MRHEAPFQWEDLTELDERLLSQADEVVSMREIHAGAFECAIGLRHDVDNTLDACLELARWEEERGYSSTYFILHDSPYWDAPELPSVLEEIASRGHEIGIHTNALVVALETGRDADEVLDSALERLRSWGHRVTGVVAHGDREVCYDAEGRLLFVNDEHFLECARPECGAPDRTIDTLTLRPRPLAYFGLEYESYRCGRRALELSDSGGHWHRSFDSVCAEFRLRPGQLHVLQHPCWWTEAFSWIPV